MDSNSNRSRKRKPGSPLDCNSDKESDAETIDEDFRGDDKKKSWPKGYTKQNHSEIEKRRRDKMNTYIVELSSMIPMCNAMSRKLDKLTVLRMAVQHMKTLKGAEDTFTETNYKPSFLSDEDLKNLILEAAEGFLVVVGCDRSCILYVSDSIQNYLSQLPSDLVGHSFFDLIHPKDVAKVKEQLSFSDTISRERVGPSTKKNVVAKIETNQGPNRLCSGARRSFFCRMKYGDKGKGPKDLEGYSSEPCLMNRKNKNKNTAPAAHKQYAVVHSTGYLKSWPPAGAADDDDEGAENRNLSCLVAVCRVQKIHDEDTDYSQPGVPREFVSRHGLDGKFIFVDQRTTTIIGYLPQELLGMSAYEFFHQDDLASIAVTHKRSLEGETVVTDVYRFRAKAGHYIPIQTKTSSFRNPWTKELEFLLCVNSVITGFESVPQRVGASRPSQAQMLTQASATSWSEGGLAPSDKTLQKHINQLVDGINKEQPEDATRSSSKKSRSDSVDGDRSVTPDPRMARIGALVLEEIHNQKASNKRRQQSNSVIGASSTSSPGPGTSATGTVDLGALLAAEGDARHGSSVSSQASSSDTGAAPSSLRGTMQTYLLEQLIGMQNAIESMDGAAEQSDDSMSAFMNMFDPELGGDFDDLTFGGAP